ncbi:MAG: cation:proton antiporter [Deinococcota bacterium]
MEHDVIALIAAFILLFGLVSKRLERTLISSPMVFTAFGVLLSASVLGVVELSLESAVLNLVAELTLVVLLFSDAARIDLVQLRRAHRIPVRLLSVGLPLTVLLGLAVGVTVNAVFTLGMSFWELALVAVILAPTDAALGQAVVNLPVIPVRIRQALNVESGLNDGIVLPVLLLCASFAHMAETQALFWLEFAALQLTLGPLVGIAVGYLGGWALVRAQRHMWVNDAFQRISALGIALLAFSAAEWVGGNGFIAAFVAGLTLGNSARGICHCLYEFAEAEGQLLTLLTFMLFGAVMVVPALAAATPAVWLYALLSLTLVRMIPVALSVRGLGLRLPTTLFLAWFGPRGVASILYVLLLLEEGSLPNQTTINALVFITVVLSIVLHGLSALPAARAYGRFAQRNDMSAEHQHVPEMPVRVHWQADAPEVVS